MYTWNNNTTYRYTEWVVHLSRYILEITIVHIETLKGLVVATKAIAQWCHLVNDDEACGGDHG